MPGMVVNDYEWMYDSSARLYEISYIVYVIS